MKKQIFIINGSGGVGKDSFVEFVKFQNPFVANYSSVDYVKEIAKQCGWSGGKTEKDRKFLSDLKVLLTGYNDLPFQKLTECVHTFNGSVLDILFLHIREPKEIKRAVEHFKAKTLLVERDAVKKITSNMADKNVSDYDYDVVIKNNGSLDDLKNIAKRFVDDLEKSKLLPEYRNEVL